MKKFNEFINVIIGSTLSVFFIHTIFRLYEYKAYSKIYDMLSTPWYTSILVYGKYTLIVLVAALIAKFAIRYKLKHK